MKWPISSFLCQTYKKRDFSPPIYIVPRIILSTNANPFHNTIFSQAERKSWDVPRGLKIPTSKTRTVLQTHDTVLERAIQGPVVGHQHRLPRKPLWGTSPLQEYLQEVVQGTHSLLRRNSRTQLLWIN